MNRHSLGSLLLVAVLVPTSGVMADDKPPHPLHLVGDHWTAWDPPAATPDARIIVKGDTLWDLAKQINGNPYLWPQLWERNQYIKDAHWIYPGDPLDTGVQVAPATVAEQPGTGEPGPATQEVGQGNGGAPEKPETPGVLTANAAANSPEPLGAESDIYCTGYIGEANETFSYRIAGSEYQVMSPQLSGKSSKGKHDGIYGTIDAVKVGLDTGDVIYIDGGSASGLSAGTVLTAVLPGSSVKHPISGSNAGRLFQYLGRVRILSVQESTAIAEIIQSCRPLFVGARLKVYEPEPVPLGRRTVARPVNDPASAAEMESAATILLSGDGEISMGQDHVLFIDRGSDEQVTPGDMFTVYRSNREGFPPVPVGEIAVLSAQHHTALAKVLESSVPLFVGDRLAPK
ncbi:MAG: LysM peptidoglycan-binding domain-containing protein [Acidobacteriota bacterium]